MSPKTCLFIFAPNGDWSKSQLIIVDCGVGFPEEDAFGVDLQIPDTHYLEDKKDRILGIFITHVTKTISVPSGLSFYHRSGYSNFCSSIAAAFIESRLAESQVRAKITVYSDMTLSLADLLLSSRFASPTQFPILSIWLSYPHRYFVSRF
jgi:hypothetical protein